MPETIQKCLTCGGELQANARTGIPTCIYCGRAYRNAVDSYSGKLSEITNRRQVREFIKAEELCRILLEEQPESSEANWQALLSSLGVVYVKERETGASKPTFFSYTYDERTSVLQNSYYKNAVRFAPTEEDRKYYEEKGKELDALLKEFFELVAKENSYDIFISFKKSEQVTAADGEVRTVDTDDYEKAREIYERLKGKYRVFFSPESIGKDTGIEGEKYEPRILKALQTAQAMILLGSKKEYLEAQWVENEWKRYLYFMDKGLKAKNSLIYVYHRNFPILPAALAEKQLPSVDMFKGDMFSRIEEKLGFVKSGKGLSSKIKKRTVQTDFAGESGGFEYGGTRERVLIGAKGGSEIQISGSEARNLQSANDVRRNGLFKEAKREYGSILCDNPSNAAAHWGLFCSGIRASTNANVPNMLLRAHNVSYEEFHKAIECSNDTEFSWSCVDAIIPALDTDQKWVKLQPIYDQIIKYLDDDRVRKVLDILKRACLLYAEKNPKQSEVIFEQARRLFFEENKDICLAMMADYADTLQMHEHYDLARKYYEELASATKSGKYYLHLLECRLHTRSIVQTKFILKINPDDDSLSKKISELDLDEIIERVLICDHESGESDATDRLVENLRYQIVANSAAIQPLLETFVNTLSVLKDEQMIYRLLMQTADDFLKIKNYKMAETYYRECLVRNENNSSVHWGLLKCRLKVNNDYEVMRRRRKLPGLQDYKNAINCANEEEYAYYMSVFNGNADLYKEKPSKKQPLSSGGRKKSSSVKKHIPLPHFSTKQKRWMVFLLITAVNVATSIIRHGPHWVPIIFNVILLLSVFNDKKMSKLCCLLCLASAIWFTVYYTKDDGINCIKYTNEGSEITIDDVKMYMTGDVVIPKEIKGTKVTKIGEEAFKNRKQITSVTIPAGVTSIGDDAFKGCKKLTAVTISDSVTSIGERAFYECESLKKVTIGNGVKTIGRAAFRYCESLTQVSVGNNVTSIGPYAFSDCQNLTWVFVGNSVTSIDEGAFNNCKKLTTVTITHSVTSIGDYAFSDCTALTSLAYNGTKSEWKAISKGRGWSGNIKTVTCTDGTISL